MKIKTDFVTNSSSTSFVAYIPDYFDVNKYKEFIKQTIELAEDEYTKIPDKEKVFNKVLEIIEDIKNGHEYYVMDDEQIPSDITRQVLDEFQFILADCYEDGNKIVPVTMKEMNRMSDIIYLKRGEFSVKQTKELYEDKD